MEIDLNNYKTKGVKVFSGRDKGKDLRNKLKLDEIEKNEQIIVVIVPEDIYSLNSSFFLGLFGKSVRNFGEDGFRKKFIFKCDEIIKNNIDDGVSEALKESDVLGE